MAPDTPAGGGTSPERTVPPVQPPQPHHPALEPLPPLPVLPVPNGFTATVVPLDESEDADEDEFKEMDEEPSGDAPEPNTKAADWSATESYAKVEAMVRASNAQSKCKGRSAATEKKEELAAQ